MAKIIAVCSAKGGVGKTTTSINLSAGFASFDKNTLLLDLDTSGDCTLGLNILEDYSSRNIFDVFNFSYRLDSLIYKTDTDQIDVVPSKPLSAEEEKRYWALATNKSVLKNAISLSKVQDQYDFIIIDCPPHMGFMTLNALVSCHSVIVPLQCGYFSLEAVQKLINYMLTLRKIYNRNLKVEGILLTMYEPGTIVSALTEAEAVTTFDGLVFKTKIPKNSKIGEAAFNKKSIVAFDNKSSGAKAYLSLAREIITGKK